MDHARKRRLGHAVKTAGIGLMGISQNMGLDPGISAAAIISGAYFGDTTSPLSDSVNLAVAAAVAYPLFWGAAHVQINTHKVTMAGLALVAASIGFGRWRWLLVAVCAIWWLALLPEPYARLRPALQEGVEAVGLPRLAGIRATPADATWMRGLHDAMTRAGPPAVRLLLAGARNDVLVFADSTPFWLSPRLPASRHHELHPGITDTEPVQRRMLAGFAASGDPVVVREHRFGDRTLDHWGGVFRSHGVPVGSRVLDEWIKTRYRPGPRFGRYELMERIP